MKQIIKLPALLIIVLLGISCKSGGDNLNPTPTNLISGYLRSVRQLDLDSPATKYTEQAYAVFFKHPGDSTIRVGVDSVKVNGFPLAMDNLTMLYSTAGNLQMNNASWQVYSTTNIASLTYNYSTQYPFYTAAMPDTIDKTGGITIDLPIGIDSATITLRSGNLVQDIYKGATGFLSPTQLANVSLGGALLEVSGYRVSTQAFGGKNFRFIKQTTKSKAVWIK
jgi:hypothetical protein